MNILLRACSAILLGAVVSGCAQSGWVTDPDRYRNLSGFSVQAPAGPNWFQIEKDETFPNSVVFSNFEQTPIRNNPDHPEFGITWAAAYGLPFQATGTVKGDRKAAEQLLGQMLEQYADQAGIVVETSSLDTSLGADCLGYRGKPRVTDVSTMYGMVRYDSVTGYLCLHPLYDNFAVGMEARNGASVELRPLNRDHQLEHFFRSLRFTPRDLPPKPTGPPSKDEGKRVLG